MKITGFSFPILVEGDPSAGRLAELDVRTMETIDPERFDHLCAVVIWFAHLADLGGLGGTRLAPHETEARLANNEDPIANDRSMQWTFETLRIDPRSVVVLANLIQGADVKLEGLFLRCGSSSTDDILTAADFPSLYPNIPFEIQEELAARTVQLTVDFQNEVPESLHEQIGDALRYWSMVAASDGFNEPGPREERLGMLPEDDPEIILDQLTFTFRDNGMHEAAYDVLKNLFIRISNTLQPVSLLQLR